MILTENVGCNCVTMCFFSFLFKVKIRFFVSRVLMFSYLCL